MRGEKVNAAKSNLVTPTADNVDYFLELEYPRIVEKPWGKEEILTYNAQYCTKRITLKAGCSTSLQYHNLKRETNVLVSGKAVYWYYDAYERLLSKPVGAGFFVEIAPKEVHRFEAITDIVLIESSTPEVWDVVRLDDAYNRTGTSAP